MVVISEITEEEEDEGVLFCINKEAQKEKIRRLIAHQKSLLHFSSSLNSTCSTSSSGSSSSLLDLMRRGSTSLGRLFGMEHTTLAAHFRDYSCSPITKTIPLWGSDGEDPIIRPDPWGSVREHFGREGNYNDDDHCSAGRIRRGRLIRKRSFRKLPKYRFWRWRLRLRRFRVMICGRVF
ncbi:hypothetical protein LINPERPRIM_LOCUS16114 [Linum perenne]